MHRQAGLADAADTGEGHHPLVPQQRGDVLARRARARRATTAGAGSVVRRDVAGCPHGGNDALEVGVHDLPEALGLGEVAQAVRAEVDELDASSRDPARTSVGGHVGEQDLAAVADAP